MQQSNGTYGSSTEHLLNHPSSPRLSGLQILPKSYEEDKKVSCSPANPFTVVRCSSPQPITVFTSAPVNIQHQQRTSQYPAPTAHQSVSNTNSAPVNIQLQQRTSQYPTPTPHQSISNTNSAPVNIQLQQQVCMFARK
jgi:hypothetical protein